MTRVDQEVRAPGGPGSRTAAAPGRWAYRLSAGLLAVAAAAAAAAATFSVPGLLTGPAVMNGSARGTSLVALVVALPVMTASMWAVARGVDRAVFGWLGAAGYLLYNAVMFLLATPFNELFLLYVGMFSLALWAIVAVLVRTDVRQLADRALPHLPVRPIAIYTWVVAILNALAWLRTILPAVASAEPSSFLAGTGMTTNPVFIQDLGVWLPLLSVGAFWLWRQQPWGVVIVGAGLTLWAVESIGIAVDQWFGAAADPASPIASAAAVPVFAVAAVIGLVPLYFFYRAPQGIPRGGSVRHDVRSVETN